MRIVLLLFLVLPVVVFSQKRKNKKDTSTIISQPNRIEFELAKEGSDFYVISGGKEGILVVEETGEIVRGGGYKWNISMVDTAFNLSWSQSQSIPADGSLLGYEYFEGKFYLLFNKSRFRGDDLLVYQLNIDSKNFVTYEITTVFPVDITHFESVGETLLIAGYANFRPVVITYNINDRIPRVVPGFYDSKNDMLDLVVDEESELFTVILSEKMRNKKFTARVKTFTAKGDLIQDNLIDPGEKKSLLDAASTTFSNGLQYLAGTHTKKSLYYSQGFYLSKFINGAQQFNKYYPFADLNNFFSYMRPRREQRIKSKIERKRDRGKVKKFNYRLLVHEILQRDDEYIMIAEAYYPRYSYNSGGATSYRPYNGFGNRNGFQSFNPDFLGYKYTHAVVVGFDRNCNIIWDNTFKIEDIQKYELEENVMVTSVGDKIVLSYLEENEIRSKIIQGNEIVEGRTFNPVRLSFEMDELKTKDPRIEGIEKWYGNTLFAYGIQNIKNESGLAGKLTRRVFYLNKIRFDLNKEVN
ncbi:MAG: hypothetical protein RIM99_05595 [Cyclobacteriaceae bacterium]